MDRTAICCIFKDEADNLLEWLAYHLCVGFDHVVLFDNGSSDGGANRIKASRLSEFVTIIDWPERPGQMSAYGHFCEFFSDLFDWAAFIDIDEFVQPLDGRSIKPHLSGYTNFSGVLLQWLEFGPSGHVARPSGLVIENYVSRLPETHERCRWVKSLLRTSEIIGTLEGPHILGVRGGLCNARGEEVPPYAQSPYACHDRLVINHYFTKSRDDWACKMSRGAVIRAEGAGWYGAEEFEGYVRSATWRDDRILRFAPMVHRLLEYADHSSDLDLSPAVGAPLSSHPGALKLFRDRVPRRKAAASATIADQPFKPVGDALFDSLDISVFIEDRKKLISAMLDELTFEPAAQADPKSIVHRIMAAVRLQAPEIYEADSRVEDGWVLPGDAACAVSQTSSPEMVRFLSVLFAYSGDANLLVLRTASVEKPAVGQVLGSAVRLAVRSDPSEERDAELLLHALCRNFRQNVAQVADDVAGANRFLDAYTLDQVNRLRRKGLPALGGH